MRLGCGFCWNIVRYGVGVFWSLTSHLNPVTAICVSGDCGERGPWLGAHMHSFTLVRLLQLAPLSQCTPYKRDLQIPLLTCVWAILPFL